MQGRIGFGGQQFVHAHTADLADPAQIVAQQVDDHHVLRPGLRVLGQRAAQAFVHHRVGVAPGGALDGFRLDGAGPVDLQEAFGGGTGDLEVGESQIGRVGRGIGPAQRAVDIESAGRGGEGELIGQCDLVRFARLQGTAARGDIAQVPRASTDQVVLDAGGVAVGVERRGVRPGGQCLQDRRRGEQPGVARRAVGFLRSGEREQVGASGEMVDDDHPVGEDPLGVGRRRPVRGRRAAVGLDLVTQVSDVASREIEGEVLGQRRAAGAQCRGQVVQDRARLVADPTVGAAYGDRPAADPVADRFGQRPGGVPEERETVQPGFHMLAVQPERGR